MAIKYLSGKRTTALKSDILSDSLGSSADGTNTGITQTEGKLGGVAGQGNNGANGASNVAGGGGGAGAAGSSKNGGNGKASSITGSSVTYAGGGAGSADGSNAGGTGGTGGGGNGGSNNQNSTGGTDGLGGGAGGGGNAGTNDGTGGSGVVILRFTTSGTTYSTSGSPNVDTSTVSGKTILKYLSSGTFVLSGGTPDVEYLVVAGGGGSMTNWGHSGGAGAGGMIEGTKSSMSNATYTVTVGAGGVGSTSAPLQGGNSVFSDVTATGGGYGGNWVSGSTNNGGDGGSGGGAQSGSYTGGSGDTGTGAYSFDGNDYVEVNGLKTIFNGATKLSVAGWIYPRDNVDETLLGQWNGSGDSDKVFDFHINGSNKLELSLRDGSTNYITLGTTSINENEWQHVAMTYDGATTTVKLYVNGTLDVEDTSNPSSLHTGTGSPVLFGIYGDKSSNGFDGNLDDWGVWSRVITATEIEKLVNNNSPSPNITDSPAYTKVGGGSGTVSASGTQIESTNSQTNQNPVNRVYKDIGSVSDSTFYFEFDYKQKQNDMSMYPMSLQSGTGKTNIASEDMIYLKTNGLDLTIAKKNGGSNTVSSDGWITIVANTQYYCSITRSSNTASLKVYTDSGRSSNQVGGTKTVSVSDVSGLQYIHSESRGDGGGGTNMGWICDNISLTNGSTSKGSEGSAQLVSSLSNKVDLKAYYSMNSTDGATISDTATYTEDMSDTDDWTFADSAKNGVSSGVLNYDLKRDGSNDAASYDFGSTISNRFTLRFELTPSNHSHSSGSNSIGFFGLSSTTGGQNSNQDFIGFNFASNDNNGATTKNDTTLVANTVTGQCSDSSCNHTSGTKYYEIKRTSATNVVFTVYNNSDFTGVYRTQTESSLSSSITGLRYFKFANWHASGSGSCNVTGTIDNLQLWDHEGLKNDYSSASPIQNSQTNTIVEATDDGNHYIWTGSAWTEVA